LLIDLHQTHSLLDIYVPNPYSFVGLVCPSKSDLKGFEKRNIISGGVLKLSFCMICSSFEAEFSLCAPEDNDEIAQSINYNALVVPNSICLIDSKQNDSTEMKCNLPASNTPYCGIKLSNQNKTERKELFHRVDRAQLFLCKEETEIIS